MTEDTAGGRWKVSYSYDTDRSVTVSKWRADVHFPDPERPYKITVGLMFNGLAENGMPDLSEQELRFSAEEFARLHPDIDQTMLT